MTKEITEIKAFVPARDFDLSKRFYQDLASTMAWSSDDLAYMHAGRSSFLLQDFYRKVHADNFMMHMLVLDVEAWWLQVVRQELKLRYDVKADAPGDRSWGIRDFILSIPAVFSGASGRRSKPLEPPDPSCHPALPPKETMKPTLAIISAVVLLASCSTAHPVAGAMERSNETFSGTIEGAGYREGKGTLVLVSDHKTTCRGDFVYTTRRQGRGVLTCDDGRSGPFQIAAVGSSGSGFGDLSGQRYTFQFND